MKRLLEGMMHLTMSSLLKEAKYYADPSVTVFTTQIAMPAISQVRTVYPSNVHVRLPTQYAKFEKTTYLGSIQRDAVTFSRSVTSNQLGSRGDQALKRRIVALKPKNCGQPPSVSK
jgi:hypothetical protein